MSAPTRKPLTYSRHLGMSAGRRYKTRSSTRRAHPRTSQGDIQHYFILHHMARAVLQALGRALRNLLPHPPVRTLCQKPLRSFILTHRKQLIHRKLMLQLHWRGISKHY